jgi:hypothetical protein
MREYFGLYIVQYTKNQINMEDLSKFARFPGGIPENVKLRTFVRIFELKRK